MALGTAFLWRNQERIVFQPPRLLSLPAREATAGYRSYLAGDGQPLYGYLVGTPFSDQPLVIAFHGNADLAEWLLPWAHELHTRIGVPVLLPEYRGYGGLGGRPTYAGTKLDAQAALHMARTELGLAPSRLVLFGHSLGSAVATELAAATPSGVLVLESPFTSARAMASRMLLPSVPLLWNRISRVHFDTCAQVAQLPVPVYVAHGERDLVIPASMGRQVHAAARVPGQLLIVPEAGHNDVAERGQARYWQWFTAAVDQVR